MTMRLENLIAELEAARHGSPALDWEVGWATGNDPAKYWTKNFDDAISLINGLWWIARPDATPYCRILPANPDGGFVGRDYIEAQHDDLILAIVIAALKVRALDARES